ncbi:exodeoxyribonuclease I [Candidatus Saccharibacteria bacterium]|nr:exodeoxyribonuclease I [Candidatus Saccharibacteria bacterium]
MTNSFYFYDLETSGVNPRQQRIMQFAGQRTDMDLNAVGEPHNILLKLTDDVVPDPWAILVTGITPQKTKQEGITEAEFLKIFSKEIAVPGTIFIGFNTVRFDDEFMRYLHYRNFYDAFEWHWKDGKSRWDLLDASRMMRALRPEGIKWPFATDGKPTNRLESLTKVNNLAHDNAHDALSDVQATIALAKLIKNKQPKLFEYLLNLRDKKKVESLVSSSQPFVYSSGKYSSDREKTAVAMYIGDNPKTGALVFDLYQDPSSWLDKSPVELAEAWKWKKDSDEPRLPVKTLQYNRCPAVAPLSVLDDKSKQRLKISDHIINKHQKLLEGNKTEFYKNLLEALKIMNKQQQSDMFTSNQDVDAQLYDGFFGHDDKKLMNKIHSLNFKELAGFKPRFQDKRLQPLFLLFKARNFPEILTEKEQAKWQAYKAQKLIGGGDKSKLAEYFKTLQKISADKVTNDVYLLEELKLYGESIAPHEEV